MKMWKYAGCAVAVGTVTYGLIELRRYFAGGVCLCPERLDRKVVIITGATSGIGKQLAIELAKRGAILILGCRDLIKANAIKSEIIILVGHNCQIHIKHLELNSFESVIKFAESIHSEFKEIYALVNNAGVFYHPQKLTQDNFDVTFQTNYLAPFVLTYLLFFLKSLDQGKHARIVNVASNAHKLVNSHDLSALFKNQVEPRNHFKAYGASKLALILFTKEFANRIKSTNIVINAVDPGNVETPIYRHFPLLSNKLIKVLLWPIRRICVKTPYQGAQSILHALLMPDCPTGKYIVDCKIEDPSADATDDLIAYVCYNETVYILSNILTESEC